MEIANNIIFFLTLGWRTSLGPAEALVRQGLVAHDMLREADQCIAFPTLGVHKIPQGHGECVRLDVLMIPFLLSRSPELCFFLVFCFCFVFSISLVPFFSSALDFCFLQFPLILFHLLLIFCLLFQQFLSVSIFLSFFSPSEKRKKYLHYKFISCSSLTSK